MQIGLPPVASTSKKTVNFLPSVLNATRAVCRSIMKQLIASRPPLSQGQCERTLLGHTNFVYSVNFNPAKNMVVSGSFDETMRLWDVEV
jgi:WD40 repeat protein